MAPDSLLSRLNPRLTLPRNALNNKSTTTLTRSSCSRRETLPSSSASPRSRFLLLDLGWFKINQALTASSVTFIRFSQHSYLDFISLHSHTQKHLHYQKVTLNLLLKSILLMPILYYMEQLSHLMLDFLEIQLQIPFEVYIVLMLLLTLFRVQSLFHHL